MFLCLIFISVGNLLGILEAYYINVLYVIVR